MAFVVEDGTGLTNANSYASVAEYRAYHTERGRDVSAQLDAAIQGYLVRATDHVEKTFGRDYKGTRETLVQSLGMPRENIIIDGVTQVMRIAHVAAVSNGGTGYVVGDIVTAAGGEAETAATFRVEAVNTGVVTAVSVVNRGDYATLPANPVVCNGGSGAGLTLTVQFGVALQFVYGVIEYALRASKFGELTPDSPVPFNREDNAGGEIAGTGLVTAKSEKVGPISESTTYADPTTTSTSWSIPKYPAADLMIAPFTNVGGGGKVIRN